MESNFVRCSRLGFPLEIEKYAAEKLYALQAKTNYEDLVSYHLIVVMLDAFESIEIQKLVESRKVFPNVPEKVKAAFRLEWDKVWYADIPRTDAIMAIDRELSKVYSKYGFEYGRAERIRK